MNPKIETIKKEIKEFVKKRDATPGAKSNIESERSYHHKKPYALVNGQRYYKDKLCKCNLIANQVCDICQGVR